MKSREEYRKTNVRGDNMQTESYNNVQHLPLALDRFVVAGQETRFASAHS